MPCVRAPTPPRLVSWSLLLVLLAGTAQAAAASGPAGLARRLAAVAPGTVLRVRCDDGTTREGRFAAVTADSLTLVAAGGEPARCALAAVVGVRREAGGAGAGWRTGTRVGAVLGAAAGLFMAALVDAVEEGEGETLTVGYAAAAAGAATAGAVACGGLGAALAGGSRGWADLPPAGPRRRQRLVLQAGLAAADGLDTNVQGPYLRGWLPRRLSAVLDAGPEIAWSGLGATQTSWTGETATWADTWSLGLAARLAPAAPGLQPFASAGLGWSKREESLIGLSLGAGLRWHRADGGGLDWELRWHSSPSGSDDVPPHGQWTVAAGWSFAI